MALTNDLITQFVKATRDTSPKQTETTVYAKIIEYDGRKWAQIDGSELRTPIESTAAVKDGDRVTVMIKDHTATVTGNLTDPSASGESVKEQGSKISEFEIVMAYKVSTEDLEAINATIESLRAKAASIDKLDAVYADIYALEAKYAELEYVKAGDLEAINADIEKLVAKFGTFTDISTEDLEALNAEITNLKSYNANFTYVSADVLSALKASINDLDVKKLTAEQADLRYANIDFSNIGEAAVEKLFSESGIIRDLIMSEGHVTGKLVGVTIVGDLIEGGTVKADKLVVLGEDGLYYKLNVNAEQVAAEQTEYNSLNGKIITAKSITAEKVRVDDLVAFDATIGGFSITDRSLYSGVKQTATNTTRGVYLDKEGQIAFGDAKNFIRYYKDQNGKYKLEISASQIVLGGSNEVKDLETVIKDTVDNIEIGARNLIRNSTTMIFDNYYFEEVPTEEFDYLVDEEGNMLLDETDSFIIE